MAHWFKALACLAELASWGALEFFGSGAWSAILKNKFARLGTISTFILKTDGAKNPRGPAPYETPQVNTGGNGEGEGAGKGKGKS